VAKVKSRPKRSLPSPWSIGIYSGSDPFQLVPAPGVKNPVLTASHVTDVAAEFVADPFMIKAGQTWHMFFEVMNGETGNGEIGLATSSNGLDWTYKQIVLREPFHLSYPYVFGWRGAWYMVPETLKAGFIQLYKATKFPTKWSLHSKLVPGTYSDPSIVHFARRWWLFACSTPHDHDTLRLYFSPRLLGPWREHPASPIVEGNQRLARPAGRVLTIGRRLTRFTQDCYPYYGKQVRAFEIATLTPDLYRETELDKSPVLTASGRSWNRSGMHHIDPHRLNANHWIACVDGLKR
jgi:hypothetical protein